MLRRLTRRLDEAVGKRLWEKYRGAEARLKAAESKVALPERQKGRNLAVVRFADRSVTTLAPCVVLQKGVIEGARSKAGKSWADALKRLGLGGVAAFRENEKSEEPAHELSSGATFLSTTWRFPLASLKATRRKPLFPQFGQFICGGGGRFSIGIGE